MIRETFFHAAQADDGRRCRVCGHYTVPIVRRTVNGLLVVLLATLLAYIALDVAQDGRLDGSLMEVIQHEWGR